MIDSQEIGDVHLVDEVLVLEVGRGLTASLSDMQQDINFETHKDKQTHKKKTAKK
jgi:hypothetical protein